MTALPTRADFLRTFEALPPSTRSTAYDQAEQARADDEDRRNVWTMIAKIGHLMDDPAECAARDANYAAINASMDRVRDAALVRLGFKDAPGGEV